jgi:transcription antitermination protein NusB
MNPSSKLYRRQARILAVQALYEWDVAAHDAQVALTRLLEEEGESEQVADAARHFVQRVLDHIGPIDERLTATATNRPLGEMAPVEKAILRLALSEILFDPDVPAPAAINEAVDIAKTYGGDNSGRFINGVLGTIMTQMP